ncbi:MAG: hypothetical protein A2W11_06295 [Ignavibacteria bacterium RBG_16_35_7]|nr:MAG: hypothetical protein A2W11_06295 [Ignavibacteria bacterium RBG_16_35_7]
MLLYRTYLNNKGKYTTVGKSLPFLLFIMLFLNPVKSTAQVQQGNFVFEGITRHYMVYLPQNYNSSINMPLVISLHGYTLDMIQQMNYTGMNTVADSEGFIVVYPNAVQATWNCGVSGAPNVNDVGFIDVLIDTLSEHYSIDKTKIYSCGFSRGGVMSNRLACELNNRIAAVAAVGGTMVKSLASSCFPDRHVPILYFHGTNDPIVPYNGNFERLGVDTFITHWTKFNLCTESDTSMLQNLDTLDGCNVQKITHTNCSDSTVVVFYRILNGGHTWPSGNPAYLIIPGYNMGNTNFDINASEIMWDFFKNYQLAEATLVKDDIQFPLRFSLFQNYPNPFNPSTKISWQSPVSSWQTLKVYDVIGNEITILVDEYRSAGNYEVEFSAKGGSASGGNAYSLASGIYFYQLRAGEFISTKKMVLIR